MGEKHVQYEIERVTHGIDRYYVDLYEYDGDTLTPEFAIELIEKGEIDVDSHEDIEWGPFEVTDVFEEEEEDEDA